MSQGNQKHDNHHTKIRFPWKKYIITAWYGSLYSCLSHFITPDVDSSYLLRHAQFSGACCLKKTAASAVGSSKKKKEKKRNIQLGMRKATANTSSFYFDLLHFVIIVTKGLCSNVWISRNELIYFLATTLRFADQTVCTVFVCDCTYKYFNVHKWTCLGKKKKECWCRQGGIAAGGASEPKMCLWVTFSVKRRRSNPRLM